MPILDREVLRDHFALDVAFVNGNGRGLITILWTAPTLTSGNTRMLVMATASVN